METNLGAALIAALAEKLGELGLDMSRVTLGQDDAGAYVSDGTTVTRCTSLEEMRAAAVVMAGGAGAVGGANLPGDWTVLGPVIVARSECAYQPPPRGVVSSEPARPRGPYFCGVWTDDGTHYFPMHHRTGPAKVITFEGPKGVAECIAGAMRKPTSLDLEFSDQPPGVFGANKQRVPIVSIDGARLPLPGEPQDLVEALANLVGAPRVCGPYTIRGRGCLGDPTGGALFGEHMTREAMLAWLDARDDEGTFEIIDESDGIEACGYDTGTCGGGFACDCGRSDCPDTEPDAAGLVASVRTT